MSLWDEIQSQAGILASAADRQGDQVGEVAEWFKTLDFGYVVAAARGTSDNAARYAQYLWGARNRLNVALSAPSLFGPYESPPSLEGSLVMGISQSGESPDLLAVLAEAGRQKRPTLAITNNSSSPMAQLADRSLDVGAGPELAVAATKSYTTELLAIAMLSAALTDDREMQVEFGSLETVVSQVLSKSDVIKPIAASLAGHDRCVVVGRGFHHATAHEWALKTAELSYLVAQPFSSADFRHGPMAMVEPGLVVLAVATKGVMYDDLAELLTKVQDAGAHVVAISDRADCPADQLIEIPSTPEWFSPIPAIVAAQIFTYHLTVAKGHDPDKPRMLNKVTKTR